MRPKIQLDKPISRGTDQATNQPESDAIDRDEASPESHGDSDQAAEGFDWGLEQPPEAGDQSHDPFSCQDEVLNSGQYDDKDTDDENDEENQIFGDMQLFFHAIQAPQFIPKFIEQKVTLGQLLNFEEQDLINCGVELVGDRKKILGHIAEWHSEKWLPTSLHDLTAQSMLTSPGIYITINDINKHLTYIDASFRYIKRHVQKKSDILELGKDYCGVGKIADELLDVEKTVGALRSSLSSLKLEIFRHIDDPLKLPANLIDANYVRRVEAKLRRKKLMSISVATLVVLGGVGIVVHLMKNT